MQRMSLDLNLQDWQAQAVQCESDISFQRGQIQHAYIGQMCSQLQQPIQACVQAAAQQAGAPHQALEATHDLLLTIVQAQTDLLSLAPPTCTAQV